MNSKIPNKENALFIGGILGKKISMSHPRHANVTLFWVAAIMQTADCEMTEELAEADIVVLNTCSIRENAEQKVQNRLQELRGGRNRKKTNKIIGVIGCMAERMGEELLRDYGVDFVAGPDAYMDIPNLLALCQQGQPALITE